ncbi:MAG: hypothetical protein ACI9UH_000314 [Gammaproteobacteria bacterium]|jgi:hypothetical protein
MIPLVNVRVGFLNDTLTLSPVLTYRGLNRLSVGFN